MQVKCLLFLDIAEFREQKAEKPSSCHGIVEMLAKTTLFMKAYKAAGLDYDDPPIRVVTSTGVAYKKCSDVIKIVLNIDHYALQRHDGASMPTDYDNEAGREYKISTPYSTSRSLGDVLTEQAWIAAVQGNIGILEEFASAHFARGDDFSMSAQLRFKSQRDEMRALCVEFGKDTRLIGNIPLYSLKDFIHKGY